MSNRRRRVHPFAQQYDIGNGRASLPLQTLSAMAYALHPPGPQPCQACGLAATRLTLDGLPWCEAHWLQPTGDPATFHFDQGVSL